VQPGNATADSSLAPPQNQVTFVANVDYSDGSLSPIASGVTWSADSPWVSLSGNTAICTQLAPVIVFNIRQTAKITASATVGGTAYSAHALLTCF
jgi:hypothetical protein